MSDGGFKGECSPVAVPEEMDPTETKSPSKLVSVVRVRSNAVVSVRGRPLGPPAAELVVEHHLISGPGEVSYRSEILMGRTGSSVEHEDGTPNRLTDTSIVETLASNPDETVAVGESHARAFSSVK